MPDFAGRGAPTARRHADPVLFVQALSMGAMLLVVLAATPVGAQPSATGRAAVARAVQEIETLNVLRSTLARTFAAGGVAATDSTFAQVCKPVKGRAMQLAQETGWSIVQLAERNRNPENALDPEARRAFQQFVRDTGLTDLVRRTSHNGVTGSRYFRRITVESACLACHGSRASRPAFVASRYPTDRAYGFAAGDLRGVYSVFIPDASSSGGGR